MTYFSKRKPKVGEKWRDSQSDPWCKDEEVLVKIVDIRQGWVRHTYKDFAFPRASKLKDFLREYEFYEEV